jgi:TetR/AcrR family transcriptional regulator, transcriptional repressor for nem operon
VRYPPDQKAKARATILEAGATALRENGFNGIGVDGLAGAAGVTSGAFYSNFRNKEALLDGVIETYLGQPFIDSTGSVAERRDLLRNWLAYYISDYHRENPAIGCVMPTLSADVARANPDIRQTYRIRMTDLVRKVADVLPGAGEDRTRRAWSIVAMMVGGIGIARAMADGEEASQAIRNVLATALSLIGKD